jgi:ATP adenylyltransferase
MAWIGAAKSPDGCVFCTARDGHDDRSTYLLQRSEHAYLVLNAYPYASGHLMAVVNRHLGTLGAAQTAELADMMQLVQRAVEALTAEYRAEGFNVGMNQGAAGGAGIAHHLHQHVVPRWIGDQNFMPVIGHTKTLPQLLQETRELVAGAWDAAGQPTA